MGAPGGGAGGDAVPQWKPAHRIAEGINAWLAFAASAPHQDAILAAAALPQADAAGGRGKGA